MSVAFEGLEDVINSLEKIANPTGIEAALKKACLVVERQAKINAQAISDTGNGEGLAGSISSRVNGLEGVVFTPLFYAPYVEYGTGKEARHPTIPGRQDVPWVYVKNSGQETRSQKSYTEETAKQAVAALRGKGLDAYMTYGQKPQPFLRPALDDNRQEILRILKEGITKND